MTTAPRSEKNPAEVITRWEQFGGAWRILHRTTDSVTVSLTRCDGGEEVQRLVSGDPVFFTWLDEHTAR